jgi:hypothetical protein
MALKAVFYATGGLWITDGTEAGTLLLASTATGYRDDAAIGSEVLFNAYIPYVSSNAYSGNAIGVTDGTAADLTYILEGTSLPCPNFENSTVLIGDKLLNEQSGSQLLVTDGTQAGTYEITSPTLPVPFNWTTESSLYSLGNEAIFCATNVHSNYNGEAYDLWVTDGTTAGTMAIVPVDAATAGLDPTDITVFGNKAVFKGQDSSGNDNLWVTDGTTDGTLELFNGTLPIGASVGDFMALGSSEVLFQASGTDGKSSLWATNGTAAGTTEIYALPDSYSTGTYTNPNLNPDPVFSFGGEAFFWGLDMSGNAGLWATDGTTAGTRRLSVPLMNISASVYQFEHYISLGNRVLFEATDSLGKVGLWISDGTSAGTREVVPTSNVYLDGLLYGVSDPRFTLAGNQVVFAGEDAAGNIGLWTTDGSSGGTYELYATSGASIMPYDMVSVGVPLLSISGTSPGQSVNDNATIAPFETTVIADTGGDVTDTVTITLSSAANGGLSNLGGGSYNSTTGVYAITGTAAAVTTAIQGLIFTPTAHLTAPGAALTTTFTIAETDTAGYGANNTTTTVVATGVATPPSIVNAESGGSFVYTWYPIATARETIAQYSGTNATGRLVSTIVDNTDGTSYLYAYNPSPTANQTTQNWSATNAATGAPAGNPLSDVVNNTDGSTYVYAYSPTSTVKQTTQHWSGTNTANGAPSGNELADVVNNTDGTTLVYAYNPIPGVAQTTTNWSATNPDGSSAGIEIAAVIDNSDGTAVVYAFAPTSTVTKTATFFAGFLASTGAPTGTPTSKTIDYTNGQSSLTTYNILGGPTTVYYSGPDGTGSRIPGLTALTVSSSAMVASFETEAAGTIQVSGSGETIDPGTSGATIQFLSGASDDTVVARPGGYDTILGFDPAAGDKLDLGTLFADAGLSLGGDVANLADWVTIQEINGAAAVLFDPTGHGGGSEVALLVGDGGIVAALQTGNSLIT